jgi:hypothetical protein
MKKIKWTMPREDCWEHHISSPKGKILARIVLFRYSTYGWGIYIYPYLPYQTCFKKNIKFPVSLKEAQKAAICFLIETIEPEYLSSKAIMEAVK